jgi:peptidoglycan hydrolase CwlO-like protein
MSLIGTFNRRAGQTLTSAQADLNALRLERKRLLAECGDVENEIRLLSRSDSTDAIQRRVDSRSKLAKLKSELELLDETIATREKFIRELQGELGGLVLRKRQVELSLSNGYFDSYIAQCLAFLKKAEAEKKAALNEIQSIQSRIDEISG